MAVLLADLIYRADIGMVEGRSRLSLTLKPGQRLRVPGHLIRQELQGNKTMESSVLGLVDHTHPATAQLLNDAVVRDGLADHGEAWELRVKIFRTQDLLQLVLADGHAKDAGSTPALW
jgi:hypothetical protein